MNSPRLLAFPPLSPVELDRGNRKDCRLLFRRLRLGLAILLPLAVDLCHAATLRVPSQLATFDDALLTAVSGDTVLVAPGTYSGVGNRNLEFYGKDLVVISEGGADVTILDLQASADNPGRGFLIQGGETEAAVLDGFTIINGYMSSQPSLGFVDLHDLSAGGFKVHLQSDPTIRNMIVRRCHSEFTGGGISIEVGARPTLINCVVTSCTSSIQGGGISIESGSAPRLIDCVFTGNRSGDGGGVALHSDPIPTGCIELTGCTIAGNHARRGGGVFNTAFSCARLERVLVARNCASESGHEMFLDPQSETTLACSLVDSSAIGTDSLAQTPPILVFEGDNLLSAVDPYLCHPDSCVNSPSDAGDYGLADTSPALANNSPCGGLIGALGKGSCATPEPVLNVSWGQLKTLLGSRRDARR